MNRDYRKFGIEGKTHYKLFKSGKKWVTTGITVFSIGIGLTFTQFDQVKAATQTSSSDSTSNSSVSSGESNISGKTVALKASDTSTSDSSATSSATSAASQSSSTSDTQSTNADKTSSVASSATSESENAGKSATSSTSSTSSSSTTESSAVSSATVGSSSQDKSAKTTGTSTSGNATKASESKTVAGPTDTSTTAAEPAKIDSVASSETTDNSGSSSGDTKIVSDVANEGTSTTVNAIDTNTDNLSTTNSSNSALTTEKTALAAAVATKATRASLVRAAATNTVELVTTGTLDVEYGALVQGLGGIGTVVSGPTQTIQSGNPDIALYAKNAGGNYLVDINGNKVNLLYGFVTYGDLLNGATVSYTNMAGVTSDVSGSNWSSMTNAGTYNITLTADGESQLTTLYDDGLLNDYTFADDTDVDSFMPTIDSFSGTYEFQVVIIPATLVSGSSKNAISLGSASQTYDGSSINMLPIVTVLGATGGSVLRVDKTGKVTAQLGTDTSAGSVILTSADFDYTYSDGTSNLTGYDAGSYILSLNATGIAAMQAALGQNYTLVGKDDNSNFTITGKGTVKQAALGLTTSTKEVTYNGSAQGTGVTVTNGTNFDNIAFTTSTGTNANSSTNYPDGYTMTVVTADANQAAILAKNYIVTETDGTLTITPALLTVMTKDNPVTYDGQAHGTTVTLAGDNPNKLTFSAVSKDDGSTKIFINAGTYTMTGKTSGDTSNYTITYKDGTVTIAKAAATITIPSKTYWADGTTKNLTATVTGTVNNETLNYTLTDGLQTTGTETITATYDENDSVNKNYDITVTPGTLTVGDVTVEYDYGYTDADGKFVVTDTVDGKATHSTDASASDYLTYTTTGQPKTGYTLSTDDTGLAANGTLSGIGGVVKYTYSANDETVNIVYYDQTDNNKIIKTVSRTGKFGTTDDYTTADDILTLEKAGYEFVSSDFPTDGIIFDEDGIVKAYTVKLSHKVITVDTTTPGTPGQPIESANPDGPKYPAGTDTASLSKTVTRTIHYQYQDGTQASTSVQQVVGFSRTATIDEVTGAVTYGQWLVTGTGKTTGSYDQIKTPTIDGYTADTDAVDAATVMSTASDSQVTVTYLANVAHDGSAKVVYMDATTGKQLASKTLVGKAGTRADYKTQSTIDQYLKAGYVLMSDGFPVDGVVFGDGTVQTYTVYLVHGKVPATDQSQLNKVITQTIHYQDQQGHTLHPDTTRNITFTRSGIVDQVTGETTYSDWQTAGDTVFSVIDAPEIAGYQAIIRATKLVSVNIMSDNDDQTLTYEKVETLQPTHSSPVVIKTVNTPAPQPTKLSEKTQPTMTVQPARIEKASLTAEATKTTTKHQIAKHDQAKTLPQTGDDQQANLMTELLGLSLTTLLAGFGLISRKRRN